MKQAAPDPKLQPGVLIGGKYRVVRVIAQGGMGAISLCTHEELEQRVAVKTLLDELLRDEESRARFVREARAAAKLQSQHVARVTDVGNDPEVGPYLVMEYLEGANLDELLSLRGKLPIVEVVDWVLEAIDAIAEAHSLGIVHRDLKPSNLFLADRSDGKRVVKVLDFGISKVVAGTGASHVLTGTTTVVGSPVYMAPEQLKESRSVDHRADVWSLGVVLYELLTGVRPFEGDSLAVLFVQVLEREPIDVVARRPDIPPALGAVIMRCLRKDLAERMPNVAELATALAPFGSGRVSASVGRARSLLVDTQRNNGPSTAPMPGRTPQPGTAAMPSPAAQAHGSQPNIAPSQPSIAPSQPSHPVDVGARTQSGWQQPPSQGAPPAPRGRGLLVGFLALGVIGAGTAGAALYKRHQAKLAAAATTTIASAPPPSSDSAPAPSSTIASATAATPTGTTAASTPSAPAPPTGSVLAVAASAKVPGKTAGKPTVAGKPGGKPSAEAATAAPTASPPPAGDPNEFLDRRH